MSNINELRQRIAVANSESKRLNSERAINLGKKDTLTKQLDTALKSYNEKYGKNITINTLNAELEAVTIAKEQEVKTIEAIIDAINNGNYEEANKLSGVVTKSEGVTPAISEPVVTQPVAPTSVTQTVAQPIAQPVVEPVTQPVVEPVTQPVVEPVMPSAPTPVAPPVANTPVAPTPVAPTPVAPTPVAPPTAPSGLNMPTPPSLSGLDISVPDTNPAPPSFQAIIGGTAFDLNN